MQLFGFLASPYNIFY